jgi:predicted permease
MTDVLRSLIQDLLFAVRSALRRPGFSCGVIALLALAIGANVAMFTLFHQALVRPLPYAEPDRLLMGRTTFNGRINPDMSAYDYFDYRQLNRVFESVGAINTVPADVTVTGGEEPEQLSSATVSWDLFPTLGVPAVAGRHFTSEEGDPNGPDVVMISGGFWRRRFASSPDAVGRRLQVEGTARTIVGVMPAGFRFLRDADLWIPMRRDGPAADDRGWHSWLMVGRLRPGARLDQAQADVDVISAHLAREYPGTNRDKMLLLTPLQEVLTQGYRTTLFVLMAAVGLVLLIACANVASLLLARGVARRPELSVRAALGASSSRIARQLLTESMATACAGGVLGTALAVGLQRLVQHLVPAQVAGQMSSSVSWPMLAFALVSSTATGLVFGALPALQAARTDIVSDVRSGAHTSHPRGQRAHGGLVIAQIALSVVLLISSGLLIRSFAALSVVETGFDTENLLTTEIRIDSNGYPDGVARAQFFSGLLEELRAVPGVVDVAMVNQLPIRDPGNNIMVHATSRPPADMHDRPTAFQRWVLPGYFEAMGIPLVRGRGIETTDQPGSRPVLVINEAMARRLFPGEDPLGQQVSVDQQSFEVVGVVGDVRVEGPRHAPRPAMYYSYFQTPTLRMRVALRTAMAPGLLTSTLRDVVWRRDRDIPVLDLASMEEIIARRVASERVMAVSVTIFASVAALLAALGLYGILAYYVSRSAHEIGVRIALGAGRRDVLVQVMRRGLLLVIVGIGLGLVGALWASRLLQELLFDTPPTDPATFVGVGLLYAAVAVVACWIPARRALGVDPVRVLAAR